MAKKPKARREQEQGMLKNIGGRDESPPNSEAPSVAVSIGWMAFVGGALWATVFVGAGLVAWLIFKST